MFAKDAANSLPQPHDAKEAKSTKPEKCEADAKERACKHVVSDDLKMTAALSERPSSSLWTINKSTAGQDSNDGTGHDSSCSINDDTTLSNREQGRMARALSSDEANPYFCVCSTARKIASLSIHDDSGNTTAETELNESDNVTMTKMMEMSKHDVAAKSEPRNSTPKDIPPNDSFSWENVLSDEGERDSANDEKEEIAPLPADVTCTNKASGESASGYSSDDSSTWVVL